MRQSSIYWFPMYSHSRPGLKGWCNAGPGSAMDAAPLRACWQRAAWRVPKTSMKGFNSMVPSWQGWSRNTGTAAPSMANWPWTISQAGASGGCRSGTPLVFGRPRDWGNFCSRQGRFGCSWPWIRLVLGLFFYLLMEWGTILLHARKKKSEPRSYLRQALLSIAACCSPQHYLLVCFPHYRIDDLLDFQLLRV